MDNFGGNNNPFSNNIQNWNFGMQPNAYQQGVGQVMPGSGRLSRNLIVDYLRMQTGIIPRDTVWVEDLAPEAKHICHGVAGVKRLPQLVGVINHGGTIHRQAYYLCRECGKYILSKAYV